MAQYIDKKLAESDGIWRVDGVVSINSKEHPGRYIEVCFSRIDPESIAAGKPYGIRASKFPFDESWSLRFHCSALAHFRPGSIWHKGKEIAQPTRIEPCEVDVDQVMYVRLGERVTLGGQTFPSIISPNHLHLAGDNRRRLACTLFAVLPVKGGKDQSGRSTQYLVVPATEIFVFYLASSARLVSAALQGRVESYIAFNSKRDKDKVVTLHTKKRLTNLEAHVLARAVTSEQAETALFGPNQKLTLASLKGTNFFEPPKPAFAIEGKFPFRGDTCLHALGRRWNYSVQGKPALWIAYAMEITRCDHLDDFEEVIQVGDELVRSTETGAGLPERTARIVPVGDIDTDHIELNDQAADKRLPRRKIPRLQSPFVVDGIKHGFMTNATLKEYNRLRINIPEDVIGTTLDDGDFTKVSKGNLGVDAVPIQDRREDGTFASFLQVALSFKTEAMRERKWAIEFERINERGLGHQYGDEKVPLTTFPFFIRNERALRWHKVELENGEFRPRSLMVMKVASASNHCFYLLEMESKDHEEGRCTVMLHSHDFTECSDETLDSFLELTTIQNRWVGADDKDNWTVDKRQDEAALLFALLAVHRLGHPPKEVTGDIAGQQLDEGVRLSRLATWRQWLMNAVDNVLANYFAAYE